MQNFKKFFIILALSLAECQILRKFVSVFDKRIENCAKPEEDAKALDVSNFEFIAESDEDVFINGSIKILRDFKNPVPVHFYAERFDRDQWIVTYFDQKRPDFCAAFKDPKEVWYTKFQKQKGCPLKAEVTKWLVFNWLQSFQGFFRLG